MKFELLGPLHASVGSAEVGLARRERVLLAVLLLHANRTVSATQITDAVWGDRPPADASGQVHSTVYRLRKQLAAVGLPDGLVVTDPAGYRLCAEPRSVDLVEFRELRDRAREAAAGDDLEGATADYRAALALWRGPALDGMVSDLVRQAAAGLDEEHLQAVEECVEAELSLGRGRELVAELTELVERHPHREGLHRALMLALYRAGRQADALAAFRRARQLLHDELGIEPGAELQQMQHAILNRDPALLSAPVGSRPPQATHPVPRELPADVSGFTGRAAELKALDNLLAGVADGTQAPVVISTITGTAGVGKTALAVHWAHRVANRFPDGQLYINLRGYTAGSPLRSIEAIAALLRSLGTPPEQIPTDLEHASSLYRTYLADRRTLIVLDNARTADQIRPLLPGSAGCLVLITSRDRLNGLVARDGAYRHALDTLTPEEACHLLENLLGNERVRAEPAAIAKLAEACVYLPLALRIAAANIDSHADRSIESYVLELTSGDRLAALQADGDRDTAILSALKISYNVIPKSAQRLFRLLGLVHCPDYTPASVAALAKAGIDDATEAMRQLANASLVNEHAVGRYTVHDLLRLFASKLADLEESREERVLAVERLFCHYLSAGEAAARILYPQTLRLPAPPQVEMAESEQFDRPAAARSWLEAERTNMVVMIANAVSQGSGSLAWLLADCLRGYFWLSRNTVDWLTVADAALTAAEYEGNVRAMAAAQLSLADAYLRTTQHDKAMARYQLAAKLAQQAGSASGEAAALGNLGIIYKDRGQLTLATEHQNQALSLHRSCGLLGGQAANLTKLGVIDHDSGRLKCGRSRNSPGPRSRNSPSWPCVGCYLVDVVAWGTTRPGRLLGR